MKGRWRSATANVKATGSPLNGIVRRVEIDRLVMVNIPSARLGREVAKPATIRSVRTSTLAPSARPIVSRAVRRSWRKDSGPENSSAMPSGLTSGADPALELNRSSAKRNRTTPAISMATFESAPSTVAVVLPSEVRRRTVDLSESPDGPPPAGFRTEVFSVMGAVQRYDSSTSPAVTRCVSSGGPTAPRSITCVRGTSPSTRASTSWAAIVSGSGRPPSSNPLGTAPARAVTAPSLTFGVASPPTARVSKGSRSSSVMVRNAPSGLAA